METVLFFFAGRVHRPTLAQKKAPTLGHGPFRMQTEVACQNAGEGAGRHAVSGGATVVMLVMLACSSRQVRSLKQLGAKHQKLGGMDDSGSV